MNQCELHLLAAVFKSQHDDIKNEKDKVLLFLPFFPPFCMIHHSLSELGNYSSRNPFRLPYLIPVNKTI